MYAGPLFSPSPPITNNSLLNSATHGAALGVGKGWFRFAQEFVLKS
ncbi:hypothetical protein JCM19301_1491 [Jejuia pallidilutea]|uniref:Uncharacterized protein n=1 Tax=Jejuia pallidilutea TaxID=504487 RepID=A0A090WHI0_9FLAO|nr:hypothetical protein JCM19301_1491 [Jejuia pallidilutea]GAL70265.1 hypothetical protein JCM19302_3387 [Jejuia pallidilutea]